MSKSKEEKHLMENKRLFSTKDMLKILLERKLAMDTIGLKPLKVIRVPNIRDNGLMIKWRV